ncbi:MAG: metallophosphoesterase [Hyphomicrobiales bacterium]|nr:metallophosphoesterase [Hyphomicrobiales bacterium]
MFTLAHLSDPHLAPLPPARLVELAGKRLTGWLNWQRKRHLVHDRATLKALLADLQAQGPDHIAVTGDIANIGLPAEYARGREWLASLGPARDVSFIPGNHDIYVAGCAGMAAQAWSANMQGDAGESFPYVRRRGPVALIGLSSGVVTAPFMATGEVGPAQLQKLAALLDMFKAEKLFRVVLIHHPPVSLAAHHKRLIDADALKAAIAAHGAELLLHGHDHRSMLNWLDGPEGSKVPAVGVPSASAKSSKILPGMDHDPAGYNLYRIKGRDEGWSCEMISRGFNATGTAIVERRLITA